MQQPPGCQALQVRKFRRVLLNLGLHEKRRTLAIKMREFGVFGFAPNQSSKNRDGAKAGPVGSAARVHRRRLDSAWLGLPF